MVSMFMSHAYIHIIKKEYQRNVNGRKAILTLTIFSSSLPEPLKGKERTAPAQESPTLTKQ